MGASNRTQRLLFYRPVTDDGAAGNTYDVAANASADDGGYFASLGYLQGRTVETALRPGTVAPAVVTVDEKLATALGIDTTWLFRDLGNGRLFRVTSVVPCRRNRATEFQGETSDRAAYTITADTQRYTVASVTVVPSGLTISTGADDRLTVSVVSATGDAMTQPEYGTVSWTSSETPRTTLRINGDGTVTGLASGSVTVTATIAGVQGTCDVTVI